MSIIATKAKELRTLLNKQTEFAREIVSSEPEFIEDLVTFQLDKGIDGDGERIVPGYTARTKQIKQAKGQPTDRVTLRDTGDYWSSIESKVTNDYFTTDATDIKADSLEDKYGVSIDKLNDQSVNIIINDLLIPELRVKNKQYLNA